MIELISTGGTYPFKLARYEPANIVARLRVVDGTVHIEIEDTSYWDRTESFVCDAQALAEVLRAQESPNESEEESPLFQE